MISALVKPRRIKRPNCTRSCAQVIFVWHRKHFAIGLFLLEVTGELQPDHVAELGPACRGWVASALLASVPPSVGAAGPTRRLGYRQSEADAGGAELLGQVGVLGGDHFGFTLLVGIEAPVQSQFGGYLVPIWGA